MSHKQTSLLALPDYVVLSLVKYLDINSLLAFRVTAKKADAFLEDIFYRNIVFKAPYKAVIDDEDEQLVTFFVGSRSSLFVEVTWQPVPFLFVQICRIFPFHNLKSLKFTSLELDQTDLQAIAQSCVLLESFSVDVKNPARPPSTNFLNSFTQTSFTKLERIGIYHPWSSWPLNLNVHSFLTFNKSHALTKFDVSCYSFPKSCLNVLNLFCSQTLEVLSFHTGRLSDADFKLFTRFTNLRKLNLLCYPNVNNENCLLHLEGLTKLTEFRLSKLSRLTDGGLGRFVQKLGHRLTNLDIQFCDRITHSGIQHVLAACSRLTSLVFTWNAFDNFNVEFNGDDDDLELFLSQGPSVIQKEKFPGHAVNLSRHPHLKYTSKLVKNVTNYTKIHITDINLPLFVFEESFRCI